MLSKKYFFYIWCCTKDAQILFGVYVLGKTRERRNTLYIGERLMSALGRWEPKFRRTPNPYTLTLSRYIGCTLFQYELHCTLSGTVELQQMGTLIQILYCAAPGGMTQASEGHDFEDHQRSTDRAESYYQSGTNVGTSRMRTMLTDSPFSPNSMVLDVFKVTSSELGHHNITGDCTVLSF